MTTFQAKIGWRKHVRGRKQKLSLHFVPTRRVVENFKKNSKKIKKIKKCHYGFIFSQNWLGTDEKERK